MLVFLPPACYFRRGDASTRMFDIAMFYARILSWSRYRGSGAHEYLDTLGGLWPQATPVHDPHTILILNQIPHSIFHYRPPPPPPMHPAPIPNPRLDETPTLRTFLMLTLATYPTPRQVDPYYGFLANATSEEYCLNAANGGGDGVDDGQYSHLLQGLHETSVAGCR